MDYKPGNIEKRFLSDDSTMQRPMGTTSNDALLKAAITNVHLDENIIQSVQETPTIFLQRTPGKIEKTFLSSIQNPIMQEGTTNRELYDASLSEFKELPPIKSNPTKQEKEKKRVRFEGGWPSTTTMMRRKKKRSKTNKKKSLRKGRKRSRRRYK